MMNNSNIIELIEKAFSMGYEEGQKEFARRDYAGLTTKQKELLRQERRKIAIELLEDKKGILKYHHRDADKDKIGEKRLTRLRNREKNYYDGLLEQSEEKAKNVRKKILKNFPAQNTKEERQEYNRIANEIGLDRKEDRMLEIWKDNFKHRGQFMDRLDEFKKEKAKKRKFIRNAAIGAGLLGAGIYGTHKIIESRKKKEEAKRRENASNSSNKLKDSLDDED